MTKRVRERRRVGVALRGLKWRRGCGNDEEGAGTQAFHPHPEGRGKLGVIEAALRHPHAHPQSFPRTETFA